MKEKIKQRLWQYFSSVLCLRLTCIVLAVGCVLGLRQVCALEQKLEESYGIYPERLQASMNMARLEWYFTESPKIDELLECRPYLYDAISDIGFCLNMEDFPFEDGTREEWKEVHSFLKCLPDYIDALYDQRFFKEEDRAIISEIRRILMPRLVTDGNFTRQTVTAQTIFTHLSQDDLRDLTERIERRTAEIRQRY